MSVVNILHVSATFCGHPEAGIVRSMYYKDFKTNVKIQNILYIYL